MEGPKGEFEKLHILGAITKRKTNIATTAMTIWNVTYRFAARPTEFSSLSSGCLFGGGVCGLSSFAFACSNSDSVRAPEALSSARRCSSSVSDILVACVGLCH